MKLINLALIFFFLTAMYAASNIGIEDVDEVHEALDFTSTSIRNISLPQQNKSFINIEPIIEEFVHFAGVATIEVMRGAVVLGMENPEHFESENWMKLAKWAIIIALISVMIWPALYVGAFLVVIAMWFKDKYKRRQKDVPDQNL